LATLKGMNFNLGDIANAFKLKATEAVASTVHKVTEKAADVAAAVTPEPVASGAKSAEKKEASGGEGGLVDPMQWWGSLTQQFQHIATNAMKEAAKQTAFDATKNMATGLAKEALKTATGIAQAATKSVATSPIKASAPAKKVAKAATKTVTKTAGKKSARKST
jgi:hypothetical protein